jgi:hypothetical protein
MPVALSGEIDESSIKLFGKWSYDGVKCNDISLEVSIEIIKEPSSYSSCRIILSSVAASSCLTLLVVLLPSVSVRPSAPSLSA